MQGPGCHLSPGVGPVMVVTRAQTCHQLAPCWVRPWVSSTAVGEQELHVCG